MPNKFAGLLHDQANECLATNIKVPDELEVTLRSARDEIREQIRSAFGVGRSLIFNDVDLNAQGSALAKPKFRMQGSFSYHTHIEPAHKPPQQIDLDDGMFLPMSFIATNGLVQPMVASEVIFKIVEEALKPLCERRGWALVPKESCVRVELSASEHNDIALYVVPDEEFRALVEKAAADSALSSFSDRSQLDERALIEEAYSKLAPDHIMLAVRGKGWRKSDPRKLEEWFNNAVATYGSQLRRVCRYLKAWRDFGDDKTRLASIALMSVAVDAYQSGAIASGSNDDVALLEVAKILPHKLNGEIPNPVVQGETLNQGWSEEERRKFVSDAQLLLGSLTNASYTLLTKAAILAEIKNRFGGRVPDRLDAIETEIGLEKKSAAADLFAPALATNNAETLRGAVEEIRAQKSAVRPYAEE